MALYPARGYGIITFVNDERMESSPPDDVTQMLREAGVIEPLALAPVPMWPQCCSLHRTPLDPGPLRRTASVIKSPPENELGGDAPTGL